MHILSHTSKPSESVKRLLDAIKQEENILHYGNGVDKITQYKYFTDKAIPSVEWVTEKNLAQKWLAEGSTIICRTTIKGQTGSGILVVKPGEDVPEAEVYTKYISHKREFRVNLFKHKLVNVREKKKKLGFKGGDFHIRNLANGYTTSKCKNYPAQVIELAARASMCSESNFIGVDIGYNELKDYAFVIEVNSGPSIEGSSVQDFVKAMLA